MPCILLQASRAALLSSDFALSSCPGYAHAGPELHCRPGPVAAPHAWRLEPTMAPPPHGGTALGRSASAAHQQSHRAGGVEETTDCCLLSAWVTVVSMQIMLAAAMKCAISDYVYLDSLSQMSGATAEAHSRLSPAACHAMARIHAGP